MQRKVIQIANSTQLISLPRDWAVKNNIKKGDSLEIGESGSSLVIQLPSANNKEKKLELTIDSPNKFLRRMLFSPYIQGYTEIKVNYKDPEVFNLVSDEARFLMGYEIIVQGSDYCVIKSVATELDSDLDNIIKRIFWSTISMMNDLIEGMAKGDKNKLESLESLEGTNNKLSYFSLRVLNKEGYKNDQNKTRSIYYTILCTEEIVDNLRDLGEYLTANKVKADKTIISLTKQCLHYFEQVNILFNKFDSSALLEFDSGVKNLIKETLNRMKNKDTNCVILSLLYSIITKISHISKEIHY